MKKPKVADFPHDYTSEELRELFDQHYDYVGVALYRRVLASHIRLCQEKTDLIAAYNDVAANLPIAGSRKERMNEAQ